MKKLPFSLHARFFNVQGLSLLVSTHSRNRAEPVNVVFSKKNMAFVALGANLDRPRECIELAVKHLETNEIKVLRRASLYRSPPMGPQDQPDFINTVVQVDVGFSAHELLQKLQNIEILMGKKKIRHWGPRIIDLDLLLFGEQIISSDTLVVPHPRMHERRFVLEPLAELSPDIIVPIHNKTVKALEAELTDPAIFRLT